MPAATDERGGTRLQGYSIGPGASSQAIACRQEGLTEGTEALLHSAGFSEPPSASSPREHRWGLMPFVTWTFFNVHFQC